MTTNMSQRNVNLIEKNVKDVKNVKKGGCLIRINLHKITPSANYT